MKLSLIIVAILVTVSALGIFLEGPLGELFKILSVTLGGASVAKKIKDRRDEAERIEQVAEENRRAEESARLKDRREAERWLDKW